MQKQKMKRTCGHCRGSGEVDLPSGCLSLLGHISALESAGTPVTVPAIHKRMPKQWKRTHSKNTLNWYLKELATAGVVERAGKQGKARVWQRVVA